MKNILNDVLPKKIDPILSPFPKYQAVPLSNGKYVFIIEIYPKSYGVYGIRVHEDLTNRNYKKYEFYNRMDGSKHQMNIEELVELIESKSRGKKKLLEVSIHGGTVIGGYDDVFISIKAVNKSERPIVVKSYGISVPGKEKVVYISPTHPELMFLNTKLPIKLEDGEDCIAYIDRPSFEIIMKKEGWSYPIQVQGVFTTNDGKYFSEDIILKEIK